MLPSAMPSARGGKRHGSRGACHRSRASSCDMALLAISVLEYTFYGKEHVVQTRGRVVTSVYNDYVVGSVIPYTNTCVKLTVQLN